MIEKVKSIQLDGRRCTIRPDYQQILQAMGAKGFEDMQKSVQDISNGKENPFEKEHSLRIVEKWNDAILDINGAGRCTIIKEIAFPNLEAVKEICMNCNRFVSLEGFCRIKLPQIDTLWFNHNQLTSVKDLRKGCWPTLRIIGIHQNFVLDSESLQMLDCSFDRIVVDSSETVSFQSQKISWIAKTKGNSLKDLFCQSSARHKLKQAKVAKALFDKNQKKLSMHPNILNDSV